jgi:WD40 repeat protein
VQIFDVAARKEIVRIDTPAGYKGSDHYASLAPDWKKIYVPVEHRKVETIERDGERIRRLNYSGVIRIFNAATGEEGVPMRPAPGSAPLSAQITPDGKYLTWVERPSQELQGTATKDETMLLDLNTGKKTKLFDDYARPVFLPDDKILLAVGDRDLQVRERDSGRVLAKWTCPDKDRFLSLHDPSPNRKLISVSLGGKKNAALEFRFLDSETLQERGKLVGSGSPHPYGWGPGKFTPNGKSFAAIDASGDLLLWNLDGNRLERRISLGGAKTAWRLAISPDSKRGAVAWSPTMPDAADEDDEPEDFPQPRVSVLDLAGAVPTRVLIAPSHGYVGGVAFSPDGRIVALGCSGKVHLFDLAK